MEKDYLVLEENLNYWENRKKYSQLMRKLMERNLLRNFSESGIQIVIKVTGRKKSLIRDLMET
jgi:hypothetical protein